MKKLRAVCLLTLFIQYSWAQHPATPFAELIQVTEMKETLSILAADAMEGRLTGSRGQKMAAAAIAFDFKMAGLRPFGQGYEQPFHLFSANYSKATIEINGDRFKNFEDFVFMEPWSKSKSTTVAFVGKATERELAGIDLQNKIALVWLDAITPATATQIAKVLESKGASGAFFYPNVREREFSSFATALKRTISDNPYTLEYPTDSVRAFGIFYVSEKMTTQLGWPRTKMEKFTRSAKNSGRIIPIEVKFNSLFSIDTLLTENVLGYIEGTDKKDEFVIITAHYDHIGKELTGTDLINNGADDDASGTTAVLQLAKAFGEAKRRGLGPRRSILFMTFTAEEQGLYGSEYYVRHPIVPLYKTVVNLNIDMIGRTDAAHAGKPEYVYVIGADKLSQELNAISETVNNQFTRLQFDYTYNDERHPSNLYRRSDHWNFAQFNIPIIFYFDGIHEDYHLPSDEAYKIEYDLLAKRTKCIFYTAWEIANREERLKLD
jgi:hypothetical protein